jgi:opacity protein-like surface antigen
MYAPFLGRCAAVLLVSAYLIGGMGAKARADGPALDWSGFYAGAHLGGAIDYDKFSDPYGPSIFGGNVRSPGPFIGLQGGYNYQLGRALLGLEADVSWANLEGSYTCLQPARAVPGFPPQFLGGAFGSTCETRHDLFGSLVARGGVVMGPQGRLLLYGKGGLAFVRSDAEISINNSLWPDGGPSNATVSTSFTQWGYTVGGGVEYAATRRWSIAFDYSYMGFGAHDVATPRSLPFADPNFPGILGATASNGTVAGLSQDVHAVKVALNYHFGDGPWSGASGDDAVPLDPVVLDAPAAGFEREFGLRYVYAWSRFQKDLGRGGYPLPVNNSRLVWDQQGTGGGELFWRFDTPENIVVKGFVGYGNGDAGHMYDEAWGNTEGDPPISATGYQITESAVETKLYYFTLDLGYDVLRGPGYKLTPFLGYNYFYHHMYAYGCSFPMYAPQQPCNFAPGTSYLILREVDRWLAWRLGVNAMAELAPGLTLTGDVAYLPSVRFRGTDGHPLRTDEGFPSVFSPEKGHGTGAQVEGILAYEVTDWASVGVGVRYWTFNVPSGLTNFFSTGNYINQRFAAEQTAVFLQGSLKFDGD